MYFPALDSLIHILSTLPGIGQRSAQRIAFHLLRQDPRVAMELSRSIAELREQVRFCRECGGLSDREVCSICEDSDRDTASLCVVEEPGDIYAIERTGEYRGKYHVLLGALSPLDGIGPEDLRLKELGERVRTQGYQELFLATNPTMEGGATAHYIADMFAELPIRVTRISHGIPTGAALEFAEQSALARSIRNRQNLK